MCGPLPAPRRPHHLRRRPRAASQDTAPARDARGNQSRAQSRVVADARAQTWKRHAAPVGTGPACDSADAPCRVRTTSTSSTRCGIADGLLGKREKASWRAPPRTARCTREPVLSPGIAVAAPRGGDWRGGVCSAPWPSRECVEEVIGSTGRSMLWRRNRNIITTWRFKGGCMPPGPTALQLA